MRTIDEVERDLKRDITEVVVPIQTKRAVEPAELERLVARASEGAVVLKGEQRMPRSFLNELYVLIQVLRAEAPYRTSLELGQVADRLEMVFALILRGESPEDRRPGVPRVL